jgi:hypothetical protein
MNQFEYQRPSAYQLQVLAELRAHCKEHHDLLLKLIPNGRCRALAITKLEEVSMWENKACVFEVPESAPVS